MPNTTPLTINIADATLDRIRARIAAFPWNDIPDLPDWSLGTPREWLRSLCHYWQHEYDWRRCEAGINALPNHQARIDDLDIHFIHEPGSGPSPRPLLLSHGWPGSVLEFIDIIGHLAHPERFGGDAADAFDVIVPSLPGFGFSAKPAAPMGPRAMANIFNRLMTDSLGYESYVAQGGDWGGAISSWLGFEHNACEAIHLNIMIMRHPTGPQTDAEKAWAEAFAREQAELEGYRVQQATRPQTLGYAMVDNPVGVAAWILEKFHDWSDLTTRTLEDVHQRDWLLDNVMIYLVTGSFNSASWIYAGRRAEGGRVLSPEGRRVEVPTAAAVFPREMLSWPPRSYVDRIYHVTRWTEMPRGGHFPAREEPALLVEDIRAFARSL